MKPRTRLDIQGMRAVAVVLVILFHLPLSISLRGGFVGVDMFYVISGFVVTNMVLGAPNEPRRTLSSIVGFLKRRVMRLLPALSVVIVATILLSLLLAPTKDLREISKAGVLSEVFLSNFYYMQNFDTYWNPEVLRSPFLHTWSLGVEFQTYLIFPLLFLAVFHAGRSASVPVRGALISTSILAGISFAAFVYFLVLREDTFAGVSPQALAFYSPLTRFWEFALGIIPAIVAWRWDWRTRGRARWATPLAWLLIVAGVVGSTAMDTLNLFVVLACGGIAILLANGERGAAPVRSALEWSPLVWIGDRSYSIYLWHWPLLVAALWLAPGTVPLALLSVAVTIALSMLTYRFVEQRFRRSAARSTVRSLLPSGAFLTAGLVAAGGGMLVGSIPAYLTPTPIAAASNPFPDEGRTSAEIIAAMSGCVTEPLRITCINDSDAETVVVLGDSLGYRSLPAVQLAAQERGLNATMLWTGGCGIELQSCPSFVYDYLAATDVAALIVAMNYDRESNRVNASELAAGELPECPVDQPTSQCELHVERVADFIERADAGLTELEGYSNHVLVALPFPQQAASVRACLSPALAQRILATSADAVECGRTSLEWQVERQGLYPQAIRDAASGHASVTLWDPTTYLCDGKWCPSVINNGELIIDDGLHWTPEAARFLYPAFAEFIEQLPGSASRQ